MSPDPFRRHLGMALSALDLPAVLSDSVTVSSRSLGVERFELHRRELTGYCYRMLGSGFEADDAVQETILRAWKAADGFEGRSSVRSWLYRIATNVCLDMLRSQQRRARPMDLGPSRPPDESSLRPVLAENTWVSPMADARVVPEEGDPAEITAVRESIRLAFVTALQYLPARQRAVLILCEVLRWQSSEVAELLDTSVAAVNSALQRRPVDAGHREHRGRPPPVDADQSKLLLRYVDAFERYDVALLVSLLHDDAIQSMPPYAMWLRDPPTSAVGSSVPASGAGDPGCSRRPPTGVLPSVSTGSIPPVASRPGPSRSSKPQARVSPGSTPFSTPRISSPCSGSPPTSRSRPTRSRRSARSSLAPFNLIPPPWRRARRCQRARAATRARLGRP